MLKRLSQALRRGRRWSAGVRGLAFVLLAALLALRVWDPAPVQLIRLQAFDLYQRIAPRKPTSFPVVIVDIDEKSLAELGQWPWPRTLIARMVDRLREAGVAAVGFDVVFAERDRMSPENLESAFEGITPETMSALKKLRSNDAIFANSLARSRAVLGRAALAEGEPGSEKPLPHNSPVALLGGDPRPYMLHYGGLVSNLPVLEKAAPGAGIFTLGQERDTVVRRVPVAMVVKDKIFPSLDTELLRIATGGQAYAIRSNAAGVDSIVVGGVRVPTDAYGRVWVHYSPPDSRRYVSAADVIAGRVPVARLRGHLAIMGTSASGLRDIKATPVGTMPGVEVHAQLLETVLSGQYLARPNYALGEELSLTALAGLVVIILVPMVGAWWAMAVALAGIGILIGVAWDLFVTQGVLLGVMYPSFATVALYGLLTFLGYVREEAERRRIRTAFSRYLSPHMVARVAEDPSHLKLGGENREMTLMFTDVMGFTRIAENYDAVGLTHLINTMLTPLTNAIIDTEGTVDKYMGDAIMAFWNAPLDDPDHARHACRAALEIQRRMGPVNDVVKADCEVSGRKYMKLGVGVGLNTGVCCVGNMGSDLRFDYSCLGDTVNTASRLEGQTRLYGVKIVVGESTYEEADDFAYLELDLIRVIGKEKPVRIYALVGEPEFAQTPEFRKLAQAHAEMLDAYRSQDWARTGALLASCRELDPGLDLGRLYDLFAERIAEFAAVPPPPDWDNVYVATSKH